MPEEYLITMVETCLRIFDQKRQKNKFFAFGLKLTIALLSAAITVVLGLSFPGKVESSYKNVALVLSALSAVMATWDAFFNHRTLWIRYTIAANRLRSLLQEINYHCAKHEGTLTDDMSSDLFKRFQEIVAAANIAWEDMRMHEPGEHTQIDGHSSNHK